MVVPILKPPAMPVLVFKIAWIAYGRKIATRCRISLNYWCERPRQNAPGEQFHFHPCRDVMGPTCITSTSRHRLMPLDLPLDKSLEEVILAVKNSSAASFSSIYKRKPYLVETDTQLSQPQREILRSSPHPLNFLTSQLPPESYVQELSSRMERCSRNRVIGRARPADYIPPQVRSLIDVSPPSTAQSSFSPTDLIADVYNRLVRRASVANERAYDCLSQKLPWFFRTRRDTNFLVEEIVSSATTPQGYNFSVFVSS